MRKLSLFSGIGGIDLAAHWAGMETVAFCEREAFPQKVLKKHWPAVPIYDDVCTLTAERLREDGIIGENGRTIDLISAGYPCQPFSVAGQRKGQEDDRHLWPEVKRLLEEIRPRWFVGENVAGHITLGLDDVLVDLESIGYTTQAFVIPAVAVGAPHRRDRVLVVGHTEHVGIHGSEIRGGTNQTIDNDQEGTAEACQSERASRSSSDETVVNTSSTGLSNGGQPGWHPGTTEIGARLVTQPERSGSRIPHENAGGNLANTNSQGMERSSLSRSYRGNRKRSRQELAQRLGEDITRRAAQPELGGMLDGISSWMDRHRWPAALGQDQYDWEPPRVASGVEQRVGRLKSLGNAVNPMQIYPLLAAIMFINNSSNNVNSSIKNLRFKRNSKYRIKRIQNIRTK